MSCHTKDTENLVKFWSRIDDKENGQYVVIVDTLDNLRKAIILIQQQHINWEVYF